MERKIKAFGLAAVLMLAALVIGCKTNVSSAPETFSITFGVEGGNGTLKAMVGGTEILSGDKVGKNKTVTFTATANEGYEVKEWTNNGTPIAAAGTNGTYTYTVTAAADIKASFTQDKTYTVGSVSFTMKGIAAVTNGSVGYGDQSNNKPHTISLSAYRIGETEVTQELWQAVMNNNPSWFNGDSDKEAAAGELQVKRPVELVDWYKCIAFCNELTKQVSGLGLSECIYYSDTDCTVVYTKDDGDTQKPVYQKMDKKGFRLPTEAEWEWAAKGGTEDKWAGTNEETRLKDYAWYGVVNGDAKTHQVKLKLPNGYGLYDMTGNVWEWCWDWHDEDNTPTGGQDPVGIPSGSNRVLRGGSWNYAASDVGRAVRGSDAPDNLDADIGMRLVARP